MDFLRIVHLYPRELGINGDVGNVIALVERARWRGIDVEVVRHGIGDALAESADLVHVGSGPLSSQRAVLADVQRIAPTLRDWRDDGVPILAIAGGWQVLGAEIVTPDGELLEGAGVFPSRCVLGSQRHVGEIVVRTDDMMLAGFENHSATVTLDAGSLPLGRVLSGVGNGAGAGERYEGVRVGESIGTHLHGPLLPMNPALADRLLEVALRRRAERSSGGHSATLGPASPELDRADRFAANARRAIVSRLGV